MKRAVRRLRRLVVGLVLTMAATGTTTLTARVADADENADVAKSTTALGVAHAEANRWEEALAAFEEAYRRDPQPTSLFNVAQARLKTRRFRAAAESYQALLAMRASLPQRQLEAAEGGLVIARARIGHVTARARGEGLVFVDDRAVGSGAVDVDPGAHVVRLTRDGRDVGSRRIDVAAGQSVEVMVEPDPVAPTTPVQPKSTADPLPPPPPDEGRSPVVGLTILGAGVVVAGLGAFFGVRGYGEWSDLRDGCGKTRSCDADEVSSARRDVIVGDVLVGVGIVGIAVGAYLWLASSSAHPPRAALRF